MKENSTNFAKAYQEYVNILNLNDSSYNDTSACNKSHKSDVSMNPTKDYAPITEHYNNYHEQEACSKCKYYRIRWIDNVCEKHHCIVSPYGICDKYQIKF